MRFKNIYTDEEVEFSSLNINSKILSAQNRDRYYWTNIEVDETPQDKNIALLDILEDNPQVTLRPEFDVAIADTVLPYVSKNYAKQWQKVWASDKWLYPLECTSGFQDHKVGLLKAQTLRATNKMTYILDKNKIYRNITVTEAERLQTVPDGYTDVVGASLNQRYKAIGNGWTIDVICHLLKNI